MKPGRYARSGVDTSEADRALARLLLEISPTQAFGAPSELGVGHFAAVIRVGPIQLALTTDGVGTKLLVAQLANRFDTVGIDCVGMNVNDLLCVGATPLAMLDYIAVESADPDVFCQLGRGLAEGAKLAGVSIVGGETAQIPEMLRGAAAGRALDIVGMALGVVPEGELVDGSAVQPGDAVIGIASNGLHSNGYTLARQVLLGRFRIDEFIPELNKTLAEELLRPVQIYVPQLRALREAGIRPRAIAHITGDGLLNLRRVRDHGAARAGAHLRPDRAGRQRPEGRDADRLQHGDRSHAGGGGGGGGENAADAPGHGSRGLAHRAHRGGPGANGAAPS